MVYCTCNNAGLLRSVFIIIIFINIITLLLVLLNTQRVQIFIHNSCRYDWFVYPVVGSVNSVYVPVQSSLCFGDKVTQ